MGSESDLGMWSPPEGSWASSPANRRSMLGNRHRDTRPELAIRALVHADGLRYRVAAKPIPEMRRTADLVFRPTRVAVFVDGCFWQGCPDHFRLPKTNSEYWREKIGRNKDRDRETDNRLHDAGWAVLRFWEHEAPSDCAKAVIDLVVSRRAAESSQRKPVPGDRARDERLRRVC